MKLKLTGLLLTLLIPLGLSSPAMAGHHEKEEASDPIAAAAEFPLLLRRTLSLPSASSSSGSSCGW